MKSPQSPDDPVTRTEEEVIGIGQDDLDTRILQILGREGLYRSLCSHWHKGRGVKTSMWGPDFPHPCLTGGAPMENPEFQRALTQRQIPDSPHLQDQHGIAIAVKPVPFLNGHPIGLFYQSKTRKGRDQKKERTPRQMEVCYQGVHHPK